VDVDELGADRLTVVGRSWFCRGLLAAPQTYWSWGRSVAGC
jgi:hypothetical protein